MKSKNLFKILRSKGFKNVKLDNIIESKYVLKRSGGSYRQFLFSFYDQNQKEWSLVPDLSVSSVVKFIQNKINTKTKWFYNGEAYRKQNKNYNAPIINQTGFEIFASNDKIKDFDTATFYSISNCQEGLSKVTLGNFLIKRVVYELQEEFSNIKYFGTLSPMQGFADWFKSLEENYIGEILGASNKNILDFEQNFVRNSDPAKQPKCFF